MPQTEKETPASPCPAKFSLWLPGKSSLGLPNAAVPYNGVVGEEDIAKRRWRGWGTSLASSLGLPRYPPCPDTGSLHSIDEE